MPRPSASSAKKVEALSWTPQGCASAKLQSTFTKWQGHGLDRVRKKWRKGGSCDRLESFTDAMVAVVDEVQMLQDSTEKESKICRYAGHIEGILDGLDEIASECQQKCFAAGELDGRIAAKSYCDLMIATGGSINPPDWIRAPVQLCGLNYEIACDSTFLAICDAYTPAAGSCRIYGQGSAYAGIWQRSMTFSCAYENRDVNQGKGADAAEE